jgi:hypothetical protein
MVRSGTPAKKGERQRLIMSLHFVRLSLLGINFEVTNSGFITTARDLKDEMASQNTYLFLVASRLLRKNNATERFAQSPQPQPPSDPDHWERRGPNRVNSPLKGSCDVIFFAILEAQLSQVRDRTCFWRFA